MSIGNMLFDVMHGNPMQQAMGQPQTARTGYMQPVPGAAPPMGGGGFNPTNQPANVPRPPAVGSPSPVGGSGGPSPAPGGGAPPQGAPLPQGGSPSVAPQSPPDLMNLYMQLYNRQRSSDMIDRGLTMMAAANASPQMSQSLMNSIGRGEGNQDPGAMLGQMMQLQYLSQLANMPPPPGIDAPTWAATPPQGRAKIIEAQGAGEVATGIKGAETKQNDLIEAQQKAPGAIDQMTRMDSLANQIKSATEADGKTPIMQSITSSQVKQIAAKQMVDAANADAKEGHGFFGEAFSRAFQSANLTPEEKAAVQNLIQLNGQVYSDAFASTGSRRTQSEVSAIKSGMTQIMGFNQPYDNYSKQFDDFQNKIHTGLANTYGASGRLDDPGLTPYRNLVDPTYLPAAADGSRQAGSLYAGGGEWARTMKPSQPGGGAAPVISGPGAAYDALPKGAIYTGPDGKQYRKS